MPPKDHPPVVLFGYDSSPFTNKVRLALRMKQIPFSYIPVPSMLPRPLLTTTFALPYRKIPILAIGRDLYCDTSLIIEALEHFFPADSGWGTVYPACTGVEDWTYRSLARGFASFWTDKPLFRTTTGLIPPTVWSTPFGTDRAQLIGHTLSPRKLGAKIPANLSSLDLHLSLLELGFSPSEKKKYTWVFPTTAPSLADLSLYYQLRWGIDIGAGRGICNLSGGGTPDTDADVTRVVFNATRYPGLWGWFHAFEAYITSLPDLQVTVPAADTAWKDQLAGTPFLDQLICAREGALDVQRGLVPGVRVRVAPDDTGRGDGTVGVLVGIGVEEVVVAAGGEAEVGVRIHFPRLGFVVRVLEGGSKL
ncbi:hypothetical protein P153DRAFT_425500 [Dothidotthia symphoricarpi CBS 119687]|uniref:GST N-terminal domain-containing protein n=1 Tax=Dothidotthia symphoricarpi CBS 119687 TaxID=1392245 RepID=A0A6A6A3B9_9PLEO|nr:uncharacterized protein P153DRAFT_425500 [Dothidotthia symphoricarpi CBS 119687]KAF2125675.1 hypothetical protein P153DRAFT_425500 [Dothidotthia symphoricarpi CBS 119687]